MTVQLDPKTRAFVLKVLDDAMDITVATKRTDGFPQATVVSFVHDGDKIYFGCDADSQKAKNIAHDNRVSVTATPPYSDWSHIRGISMGARAVSVTDEKERFRVSELMMKRFPQAVEFVKDVDPDNMLLFRLDPEVISILDYAQGFGHTELKTGLAA
ncbi:MAG: pyridoxamine 5'-phosphate oxidase family protein [Pseudomonadota bacterium]